jgi:hypothetical protein
MIRLLWLRKRIICRDFSHVNRKIESLETLTRVVLMFTAGEMLRPLVMRVFLNSLLKMAEYLAMVIPPDKAEILRDRAWAAASFKAPHYNER